MDKTRVIPTKAGQICELVHPLPDEDPNEVYIVAEDPSYFETEDNIYTVALSALQQNIHHPLLAPQIAMAKSDLSVIADDLESYIASWKNKNK